MRVVPSVVAAFVMVHMNGVSHVSLSCRNLGNSVIAGAGEGSADVSFGGWMVWLLIFTRIEMSWTEPMSLVTPRYHVICSPRLMFEWLFG